MAAADVGWREFSRRREGMIHALEGGLWLHRFVLRDERMAHLVSSDQVALLVAGRRLDMRVEWLQYKPLKYPPTGLRVAAWHWDLRGPRLDLATDLAFRDPAGRDGPGGREEV